MPRGRLLVFNEPRSPGVEDEYNAWYAGSHVPQILEHVPAITGATRFRIVPGQDLSLRGSPRYLTIYDVEADNVMDALAQLGQATQEGKVVMTDTIRSEPSSTYVIYEEISSPTAPDK
jgi:hypothetical protein